MAIFAAILSYSDDARGRAEHRPAHVKFLADLYDANRLIVSGPTDPDPDADPDAGPGSGIGDGPGALLVFSAGSKAEVAALLDDEPFARQGLIARREIRRWNIFFGALCGRLDDPASNTVQQRQ